MTKTAIKIELKRITANERLSEETLCYAADLWVDGVKIGEVSNHGHGGCDNFHPAKGFTHADYQRADERCAAELPRIPYGFDTGDGEKDMAASLEVICAELVEDAQTLKRINRMTKTKIIFFETGLPAEGTTAPLYVIDLKGRNPDAMAKAVTTKYPGALILNDLPAPEAVAAYKRAA